MSKTKALFNLMESLSYYEGFTLNHFLCPVCLKSYNPKVKKQNPISRAHIIPKAAGGTHITYICTSCNSYLGHKQDKWFGDFFRLRAENKSVLETSHKGTRFKIGGISINGKWTFDPEFGLRVAIYNDRNSPATRKSLDKLAASGTAEMSDIALDVPLLKNSNAVNVGFLTAAYLAWFRELGYSFVLQSHLEPIRRQILNPDEIIFKEFAIVQTEGQFFRDPLCAVTEADGDYFLTTIIGNVCVFFPAFDLQRYEGLKTVGNVNSKYRQIRLFKKHNFGAPVALAIARRLLVMPDQLLNNYRSGYMIYFSSLNSEPQEMFFTSEAEIDDIAQRENADILKFKQVVPIKTKTGF